MTVRQKLKYLGETLMTIDYSPATRRADLAHRLAVSSDVPTLTRILQDHLGQNLLAVIVGSNPRTVARWIAAATRPPAAKERILRDASQVFDLLTTVDTPMVARAWFMGMNPQLDDMSPAEALAAGDVRDVMAAARAYVAGG